MRRFIAPLLLLVATTLVPTVAANPTDIIDCLEGCQKYCLHGEICILIGGVCVSETCVPLPGKIYVFVGDNDEGEACAQAQVSITNPIGTC